MKHFGTTDYDSCNFQKVKGSHISLGALKPKQMTLSTESLIENIGKPIARVFQTVKTESPAIYWVTMAHIVMGIICLFGLAVDDRTLMGVNVWLKPLKFTISIAVFLMTVGYLITKYPYSRAKKNIIVQVTAWSLLLEMGIILFQASRGVRSHYNIETPFDAILFTLMGIFVGMNVIIILVFLIDTARLKLYTGKGMQWAIFLGWCMVFFGSWVGGQMIGQMAHNVGVADGGAGLPLVNWSTLGGDLRIAHFFSLHAIQIIPLFAVVASKRWKTSNRNQLIAITLFALLFAFWIGYVFYRANQGLPILS